MDDLTPRPPAQRPLLWPDDVLDLQDRLLGVQPQTPLYLVGGSVRDALLHRLIPDLDFVTPGSAVQIARQTADALGGDVFVLDAERGVARVLVGSGDDRRNLDFTQYRGASLLDDLRARDFTINAMAVDFRADLSLLIDPLHGEADLLAKRVALCAPDALTADPLRVLRAVRQGVQLGFRLLPEVTQAIRASVPGLAAVSRERVRDELFKLLAVANASAGLRVLMALGTLRYVIPALEALPHRTQPGPMPDAWQQTLYAVQRLSLMLTAISPRRTDNTAAIFDLGMLTIQLDRYRRPLNQHLNETWVDERSHGALLLLAALLHLSHDTPAAVIAHAEQTAEELRLSNPEKKRLMQVLEGYRFIAQLVQYDRLASHRFWHRYGGAGIDALLVGLAALLAVHGTHLHQDFWLTRVELAIRLLSDYYDQHEQVVLPPTLVDGHELMHALGITPGRQLGQLLEAIREGQVMGDVRSREDAIRFARGVLGSE